MSFSRMLSVLALLLLSACGTEVLQLEEISTTPTTTTTTTTTPTPTTPTTITPTSSNFPKEVLGPSCDTSLTSQSLKFVHLSDLHSQYGLEDRKYEKLKKFYENAKQQQPYTLFSNGGDDYEKGSVAETLSMGAATREVTFAMEFDVRTIGNHDFAWGEEELLDFANDPHAQVLASNTTYSGDDPAGFAANSYVEFTLGCIQVGVFGMVSKPWNELDEQYTGNYLDNFNSQWNFTEIAESIVNEHRDQVDIMVMLSHLGLEQDIDIADEVEGLDIVLGGHTHGGASINIGVNNTLVIQPGFAANGLIELDIEYDLKNNEIASHSYEMHETEDMSDYSETLAVEIDAIMEMYAPEAHSEVAFAEYGVDEQGVALIAAKASIQTLNIDAALFSPSRVWEPWSAGDLTAQIFNNAYEIERQKSGTPGINSIYTTKVTGNDLSAMLNAQPEWIYSGPSLTKIVPESEYSVALHKAPALNPELYFGADVHFDQIDFANESWQVLENYGKLRTSDCLFIDTDATLYSCIEDNSSSWSFSNISQPLLAEQGDGLLFYRNDSETPWGAVNTQFGLTSEFAIDPLPDGVSRVMKFANTTPEQGYSVQHNGEANGSFIDQGKVSDYTLIVDLYLPEDEGTFRALLQTSLNNDDDADLFVHSILSNGVGINSYKGSLVANTWQRIAFVVYAAEEFGSIEIYIDGESVGEIDDIDERWALDDQFYLFTDNNNETVSGYVNAILFVDRPLTSEEIAQIGGPSIIMELPITD